MNHQKKAPVETRAISLNAIAIWQFKNSLLLLSGQFWLLPFLLPGIFKTE